ncbi:MAG: hypothetical protein ACK56F_00960, partial [bacterium]
MADVMLFGRSDIRIFVKNFLEVTESVLILNTLSHLLCSDFSLFTGLNVTAATRQGGNEAEREPLQGLQP